MKISELMSPDIKSIGPESPISEAARLMRDGDFGAVPVADHDRLIGMVTDRDITVRAVAESRDVSRTKVRDVMTSDLFYCFDDQEVEDIAQNMGQMQVRRLPVVDRGKRLVGIVSLGDLATSGPKQAAAESLEAISQKA